MDGEEVSLTPTEYEILKFLMSHPKQVFSPRQIYSEVWKDTPIGSEGTVAVHIRHLREKLEIEPSDPRHFKVVWYSLFLLCNDGWNHYGGFDFCHRIY